MIWDVFLCEVFMVQAVSSAHNKTLVKEAVPLIITWYRENRRILPWRETPRSSYHCWIAEIMLQQTRIEAVIPYYERFLHELPNVRALAAVSEDRLLKLWEGLGYYSRARNLKKTAEILMEKYEGDLPASYTELRKLPGIGDYTAGAISSIAFGLPEPAVDGNVLRVLMRLFACKEEITLSALKQEVISLLRSEYPKGEEASLLTEGLMELGETVCLPNAQPHCMECPLWNICQAHLHGDELQYPVIPPKKPRRIEEKTVFLLYCRGRYAIRKRVEKGLLHGLWEFPNADGRLSPEEVKSLLQPEDIHPCGDSRHIFTHVEWIMTGYKLIMKEELSGYIWKTSEEIRRDYSFPTAFRFYLSQLS